MRSYCARAPPSPPYSQSCAVSWPKKSGNLTAWNPYNNTGQIRGGVGATRWIFLQISTAKTFLYDCRTIVSIRKVGNFAAIDSLLYKADIEGRSRAGRKGVLYADMRLRNLTRPQEMTVCPAVKAKSCGGDVSCQ